MKRFFPLIILATVFFSLSSSAQKSKSNMDGAMKQRLMDSLHVTSTQADSVVAINKQTMMEIRNIRKDSTLSQQDKKERMKPIKQEARMRLKNFLTDDQMMKLQQIEMDMRSSGKKDE